MRLYKIIFFSIILLFVILFYGCSSLKEKKSSFQVHYTKFKGRNTTKPHYTIKLKGNSVYYNGIANMPVLGEHYFTISKSQFKNIKTAFKESDFSNFNRLYQGNIRDLPITVITHNSHEVKYQEREAPQKLKMLANLLEGLLINLK